MKNILQVETDINTEAVLNFVLETKLDLSEQTLFGITLEMVLHDAYVVHGSLHCEFCDSKFCFRWTFQRIIAVPSSMCHRFQWKVGESAYLMKRQAPWGAYLLFFNNMISCIAEMIFNFQMALVW